MRTKYTLPLLLIVPLALSDCSKKIPAYGYVSVKMSSQNATGPQGLLRRQIPSISAVNLDISSVLVHYANESLGNSGWVAVNTNAGIYNMLMYRGGIAAEIAGSTKLPAGTITELRVRLGPNNSVFLEGDKEYQLQVPAANLNIKTDMNAYLMEGQALSLSLNFDPAASIHTNGDGGFSLSPQLNLNLQL